MSYGWPDFTEEVVDGIASGHPRHVVKRPDGGMRCPLVGHDEWLEWQEGGYRRGTVPHGSPEAVFRVEPTYILTDRLANFIVGQDLISEAMAGSWGKAET